MGVIKFERNDIYHCIWKTILSEALNGCLITFLHSSFRSSSRFSEIGSSKVQSVFNQSCCVKLFFSFLLSKNYSPKNKNPNITETPIYRYSYFFRWTSHNITYFEYDIHTFDVKIMYDTFIN